MNRKNREETLHLDCHFVVVIILKEVKHLTGGIQIQRQPVNEMN
jgi:hypothetical protein